MYNHNLGGAAASFVESFIRTRQLNSLEYKAKQQALLRQQLALHNILLPDFGKLNTSTLSTIQNCQYCRSKLGGIENCRNCGAPQS